MEPWEPHPVDGFLPGMESTWNDYWRARAPYDRAAHFLRLGSAEFLDDALEFLSERPRFSGSGYLAERMLKYLSRPELSVRDHQRVIRAAEAIAAEGYAREAWEAKRLLARLEVPGVATKQASG